MEEKNELPVEVVECINNWIVTFALAYHKRKDKDISNDVAEFITDELSMPNALTAYATKLHQANETIKVLTYDNNRLKGQVEGLTNAVDELKRWKAEAMILLSKIDHYADKHPEIKLGMGKVEFTIERAKKYDESAAGREEDAVAFAQWLANERWQPRINTEWARYETIYSDVSVKTTAELYELFKQQKEK